MQKTEDVWMGGEINLQDKPEKLNSKFPGTGQTVYEHERLSFIMSE